MAHYTYVDKETCIACGLCGSIAPDIYDYDDEGLAYSPLDGNKGVAKIPEQLFEDLEEAHDSCPTGSIKIQVSPFKQ